MAFKVCPICLLHYIKDEEDMCSKCKIDIKNGKRKVHKIHKGILSNKELNNIIFDVSYDGYREYLIERKYNEYTDKGLKSTAWSYTNALTCIAEEEGLSFIGLLNCADKLAIEYGLHGEKYYLGEIGKGTWRNALNRLKEFAEYVNFYMK